MSDLLPIFSPQKNAQSRHKNVLDFFFECPTVVLCGSMGRPKIVRMAAEMGSKRNGAVVGQWEMAATKPVKTDFVTIETIAHASE